MSTIKNAIPLQVSSGNPVAPSAAFEARVSIETYAGTVLGKAQIHGFVSAVNDRCRWTVLVDQFDFDSAELEQRPCIAFIAANGIKVEGLVLSLRKSKEAAVQEYEAFFIGFSSHPSQSQKPAPRRRS